MVECRRIFFKIQRNLFDLTRSISAYIRVPTIKIEVWTLRLLTANRTHADSRHSAVLFNDIVVYLVFCFRHFFTLNSWGDLFGTWRFIGYSIRIEFTAFESVAYKMSQWLDASIRGRAFDGKQHVSTNSLTGLDWKLQKHNWIWIASDTFRVENKRPPWMNGESLDGSCNYNREFKAYQFCSFECQTFIREYRF